MTVIAKKASFQRVDIGSKTPKKWDAGQTEELRAQAVRLSNERTEEQRIKNELVSLRYEVEEYLSKASGSVSKGLTIKSILASYLRVLNLPFRKFAMAIDTTDGNLEKYLSGQRKFNTDLAMKFGSFFHTDPELWLHLDLKNELYQLKKEKQAKEYKKYDYQKVLVNLAH